MNRGPWDSYKTLLDIRRRMNELVQQSLYHLDLFHEARPSPPQWIPPFDVLETPEEFRVYGELPGLCKEDLEVTLKGADLTVRGERRPQGTDLSATYHQAERFCGGFARSFTFPDQLDEKSVQTSLKDGLLEIRLPKRKPRTIPVQ